MKVNVLMATYNHEPYISQAIESVLMQQVDFEYELLIGEDCSTDRTREIAIEWQQEYPHRIRLLLRETNLGPIRNSVDTFQHCDGQYVAILDGDDYWTNPQKLSKQARFLDSHPECAISFHDAMAVSEDGRQELGRVARPRQQAFASISDLVKRNFIPNCTVMYRNHLVHSIPEWIYEMPMGDWPLHIFHAQHGQIGYMNEVMAAYRKHAGGIYSSLSYIRELQAWMITHKAINAHLNYEYTTIVEKELAERQRRLRLALIEAGFQIGVQTNDLDQILTIFDNWPEALPLNHKARKQILGDIYERLLFQSYLERDLRKTRQCWLRLARHKPAGLLNTGVWSIGLRVFMNMRVAKKDVT